MSTQSTSGQSFPAPCQRCGGALYQPADLCPYCGTPHPLAAPAHARFPGADGPLHRPHPADGHADPVAPNLASPDTPIPPLSHLPLGAPLGSALNSRWLLTRGLIALGVVILGYGAYSLLGDHHSAQFTYDEQDTKSTTGTIAPYTAQPAATDGAGAHAGNRPAATPPAVVQAAAAPHYHDLSESLHAARAYEDAHDLSNAQAAVNAAFLMEPDSADAQMIQHELTPLEQRRDAALQTAHVCIKDHLWNCVEHSASDALAVDSGSPEARTLLQQAIVQTGWAPLGSHGAALARNAPVPQPPPSSQAAPFVTEKPSSPAPGSLDAQARAIAQSGWRNAPASGAPPAH
jgi:hypothetical protein